MDGDPDSLILVGLTGTITHPFPGLMWPGVDDYVIGVRLEFPENEVIDSGIVNLRKQDEFEVIT